MSTKKTSKTKDEFKNKAAKKPKAKKPAQKKRKPQPGPYYPSGTFRHGGCWGTGRGGMGW